MRAKSLLVFDGFRRKEAPAQHFGHIFFHHWFYGRFLLAAEDVFDLLSQFFAISIALARVRGEERGDHCATVHLVGGLGQVLEECIQAVTPGRVSFGFGARPHQHLVQQHQHR